MRRFVECAKVNELESYACLRQVLTDLPKAQSLTDGEAPLPTCLDPATLDRSSLQGSFPTARQSVLPHRTLVTRFTRLLSVQPLPMLPFPAADVLDRR